MILSFREEERDYLAAEALAAEVQATTPGRSIERESERVLILAAGLIESADALVEALLAERESRSVAKRVVGYVSSIIGGPGDDSRTSRQYKLSVAAHCIASAKRTDPTLKFSVASEVSRYGDGTWVTSLLGELGAHDPLIERLNAESESTRWLAIRGLGALLRSRAGNSSEVADAVVAVLLRELESGGRSPWIREAAAGALGQMAYLDERVVAALLRQLDTTDSSGILRAAARALSSLAALQLDLPDRLHQALWQRLRDPSPWLGLAAAELLATVGGCPGGAKRAIQRMMQLGDPAILKRAARLLSTLRFDQADLPIILTLLDRLRHNLNVEVHQVVIPTLAWLARRYPGTIDLLLERLREDGDPSVQEAIVEVLGGLPQAQTVVLQELQRCIVAGTQVVRRRAAAAIGQLGHSDPKILEDLLEAVQSPATLRCRLSIDASRVSDHGIREAGSIALLRAAQAGPEFVGALTTALAARDVDRAESSSPRDLRAVSTQAQAEVLLRYVAAPEPAVRSAVARALGNLELANCSESTRQSIVQALIGCLQDQRSTRLREAGAWALGQLRDDRAEIVSALRSILPDSAVRSGDTSEIVQRAALRSLAKLDQVDISLIRHALFFLGRPGSEERRDEDASTLVRLWENLRIAARPGRDQATARTLLQSALIRAIQDRSRSDMGRAIVRALGKVQQPDPQILATLQHGLSRAHDPVIRTETVLAIANLPAATGEIDSTLIRWLGDASLGRTVADALRNRARHYNSTRRRLALELQKTQSNGTFDLLT